MNKYIVTYKNQSLYTSEFPKSTITLDDLYSMIETRIVQRLDLSVDGKPYTAWFCEEGKLRDLEPNLLLEHRGDVVDFLAGTVVITEYDDEEIKPLSKESFNHFRLHANRAYVGVIQNPFTGTEKFSMFPIFDYYQSY
jgi:hypothetical protein